MPLSPEFLGLHSLGLLTSCCPCSICIQDPSPGMCDDMGLSLTTWLWTLERSHPAVQNLLVSGGPGLCLNFPSAGRKREGWTVSRVVSRKVPTTGGPLGNCLSPRAAFRSLSLDLSPLVQSHTPERWARPLFLKWRCMSTSRSPCEVRILGHFMGAALRCCTNRIGSSQGHADAAGAHPEQLGCCSSLPALLAPRAARTAVLRLCRCSSSHFTFLSLQGGEGTSSLM